MSRWQKESDPNKPGTSLILQLKEKKKGEGGTNRSAAKPTKARRGEVEKKLRTPNRGQE